MRQATGTPPASSTPKKRSASPMADRALADHTNRADRANPSVKGGSQGSDSDRALAHLARLARALTGRAGMQVKVSDDDRGARIEDGQLIVPADVISHARSDELQLGYLDFLLARATFSDAPAIAALGPTTLQFLAQSIEDHRVCAEFMTRYPGSRSFIERWRTDHSSHAHRQSRAGGGTSPWRARLLAQIEAQLWHPATVNTLLHPIRAELALARGVHSTAESIAAASRVIAAIRSLAAGRINNLMASVDGDDMLDDEVLQLAAGDFDEEDAAASSAKALAAANASHAAAASNANAPLSDNEGRPYEVDDAPSPRDVSVPMTTRFDVVTDFTGRGNRNAWHDLQLAARAQTAPLKARLERALKVDEQTHWRREQERGQLDRPALPKLATAPGYRTPFRVQRVIKGRDAAVTVLIDRSGSMSGRKIALARLCAAALCDALLQLHFACEVLGYSSVEDPEMRAQYDQARASGADLSPFNRFVERLDLHVYKRFDTYAANGLADIVCGHENPDGEGLSWAAERLLAHTARRRILLVLSDGYPATGDGDMQILRRDLHRRVAQITAQGIELIGIGVLDDSVESFYPTSVVVRTLDDLPKAAMTALSDALLGR